MPEPYIITRHADKDEPNTKLNIELRLSVGAALPFSKTTPATISTTNVLY